MKKMFTLLILICSTILLAQEEKIYFDDALSQHLRKYNIKSDKAIKNETPHEVDIMFDSLIRTHLRNTYISDLKLRKVSGGKLHTDKIENPFLLITKNSAIIQNRDEIKTINQIANDYKGKVEIIVLYWDKKHVARKKSRHYNKNVKVVYAYERENRSNNALSVYKHSFGVPACFYVNQDKQIFDIDRKFFLKNLKTSTKKLFTENAYKGITELLSSKNQDTSKIITVDQH